MIEYIPDIIQILFPLAIGMITIFLYRKSQKSGLMLVSVGFFAGMVPSIVKLALGGPYWVLRLMDQGYTVYQVGLFHLFLWILGAAFQAVFAILVIAGLAKLSKQA
jgi:hypothetical protein